MELLKSLLGYLTIELYRPFKSADYIQKLLDYNQISTEVHRNRDWKRVLPFYFIHIYYAISMFYVMFLICADLDELKSVIFLDLLHIFQVERSIYLLIIIHIIMAIYNYHAVFINLSDGFRELADTILNERNRDLFVQNFQYENKPAVSFIKQRMLFVLNLFQSFAYAFGKFIKRSNLCKVCLFSRFRYCGLGINHTGSVLDSRRFFVAVLFQFSQCIDHPPSRSRFCPCSYYVHFRYDHNWSSCRNKFDYLESTASSFGAHSCVQSHQC